MDWNNYECLIGVQRSMRQDEDADVEADAADDQTKMLTDTHDVKLRHCGFCGIEVSSITEQPSSVLVSASFVPKSQPSASLSLVFCCFQQVSDMHSHLLSCLDLDLSKIKLNLSTVHHCTSQKNAPHLASAVVAGPNRHISWVLKWLQLCTLTEHKLCVPQQNWNWNKTTLRRKGQGHTHPLLFDLPNQVRYITVWNCVCCCHC